MSKKKKSSQHVEPDKESSHVEKVTRDEGGDMKFGEALDKILETKNKKKDKKKKS